VRRLIVPLLAELMLAGALAAPASAALPAGCHLAAGKIVAGTSTRTRSVDARWPGITCTASGSLWIIAQLWTEPGRTWMAGAQVVEVASAASLSGGSAVFHCTHRAPTQIRVTYGGNSPTWRWGESFARTNVAACS
jgi:hypothetical protein